MLSTSINFFILLQSMSSSPSQSNEVACAPFVENLESFLEDSGMEEDPEEIQWEADACIVAVMVHNEMRQLECEDCQWKEEEDRRRQVEEEKWIWKEKEDCEKAKLEVTHKTQVEVSERSIFLASANPFQFLKNQKLKHKSEWVGIGRVRSITILGFQNLTGIDL